MIIFPASDEDKNTLRSSSEVVPVILPSSKRRFKRNLEGNVDDVSHVFGLISIHLQSGTDREDREALDVFRWKVSGGGN